MADDAFLKALTALEATLADNQERTRLIKKRITQLRRLRAKGASYAEIVATRNGPLLVQLLTESSRALGILQAAGDGEQGRVALGG